MVPTSPAHGAGLRGGVPGVQVVPVPAADVEAAPAPPVILGMVPVLHPPAPVGVGSGSGPRSPPQGPGAGGGEAVPLSTLAHYHVVDSHGRARRAGGVDPRQPVVSYVSDPGTRLMNRHRSGPLNGPPSVAVDMEGVVFVGVAEELVAAAPPPPVPALAAGPAWLDLAVAPVFGRRARRRRGVRPLPRLGLVVPPMVDPGLLRGRARSVSPAPRVRRCPPKLVQRWGKNWGGAISDATVSGDGGSDGGYYSASSSAGDDRAQPPPPPPPDGAAAVGDVGAPPAFLLGPPPPRLGRGGQPRLSLRALFCRASPAVAGQRALAAGSLSASRQAGLSPDPKRHEASGALLLELEALARGSHLPRVVQPWAPPLVLPSAPAVPAPQPLGAPAPDAAATS